MKTQFLTIFLAASLALGQLAGCSGSGKNPAAATDSPESDDLLVDDGSGRDGGSPASSRQDVKTDPGRDGDVPVSSSPDETPAGDPSILVPAEIGLEDLIDRLLSLGMSVDEVGEEVGHPYFTPAGHLLSVNGENVQAYKYESAEEAKKEAAQVSPDGSKEGINFIRWPGPQHFYALDRFVFVYIGENEDVIGGLNGAFGGPFAGPGIIVFDPEPLPVDEPLPVEPAGPDRDQPIADFEEASLFFATTPEEVERLIGAVQEPGLADELKDIGLGQYWVLVVFRGEKPTSGYEITIEDIKTFESEVEVDVSLTNPAPDAIVAQVITYPVAVEVIAISEIADPSLMDWVVLDQNGEVLSKLGAMTGGAGADGGSSDTDIGLEPEPPPTNILYKADIRGTISSLEIVEDENGERLVSMLVEGEVEPDTIVDRARVTVSDETPIVVVGSEEDRNVTVDELEPGIMVQVLFDGPVRESYPVQASAAVVVILK